MAYRVDLTVRAIRDLKHIYRYIHADDSTWAFDWFNGLESVVYSLNEHPERGAFTPENRKLRH